MTYASRRARRETFKARLRKRDREAAKVRPKPDEAPPQSGDPAAMERLLAAHAARVAGGRAAPD